MDPVDLKQKITKRSRAIIVQHTFGITCDLQKIQKIAKKHKLLLIEDCAHALGATYRGEKVGTIGDAAFFSFGRDKIVSSVFGGVAITRSRRLADRLQKFQKDLDFPSIFWIFQQLLHPVSFVLILPLYNTLNIGKLVLLILQKLSLLSKPVDQKEFVGVRPSQYLRKLPNGVAQLAFRQLKKLDTFNAHRVSLANLYKEEFSHLPVTLPETKNGDIFLRFPLLIGSGVRRNVLLDELKKKGILLGKWYSHIVDPEEVELERIGYVRGSCPNASQAARTVINLPTYPTLETREAQKLTELIREHFKRK